MVDPESWDPVEQKFDLCSLSLLRLYWVRQTFIQLFTSFNFTYYLRFQFESSLTNMLLVDGAVSWQMEFRLKTTRAEKEGRGGGKGKEIVHHCRAILLRSSQKRKLSLCHKFWFSNTLSLQPNVEYLKYFKLCMYERS